MVLEIGAGSGEFSINLAKNRQSDIFVLIDRLPRLVLTMEEAVRHHKLNNIYPVCGDAHAVLYDLGGQVKFHEVYCFYPSPRDRRNEVIEKLYDEKTCEQILECTSIGSVFYCKSDIRFVKKAFLRKLSPVFREVPWTNPTETDHGSSRIGTTIEERFAVEGDASGNTLKMTRTA